MSKRRCFIMIAFYASSLALTFAFVLHGQRFLSLNRNQVVDADKNPPIIVFDVDKDNPKDFASKLEVSSTYKISEYHYEAGERVDRCGCAFGIDMTTYGYTKQRYLLTAAHCVALPNGKLYPKIWLTIQDKDYNLEVLGLDCDNDIAFLKCEESVPHVLTIADAEEEPDVGVKVISTGAPQDSNIHSTLGTMLNKDGIRWSASAPDYYHGSSGGPLTLLSSHKVVGIASLGVMKDDENMYIGVGKFVPFTALRKFLEDHRKQ